MTQTHIFHLTDEDTRLVVTRGEKVVEGEALSDLCQRLNAESDTYPIQSVRVSYDDPKSPGMVVIEVETGGKFVELARENMAGSWRHCVTAAGIRDAAQEPKDKE